MKIKKCLSLLLSLVFVSTSAFGAGKSSTYVTFEAYYKEITNPDRTINFKKLERILRQDAQVKENFTVLLKLLQRTKGPRAQLLFFEKDGERYPRLQIGDAKQSLFIDIHGEQERFLRIGNAYYSVEEVRTPVLFLKKYFASNPREEKRLEAELLKQPLNITYEMWKLLTPAQRVLAIGGLRSLLYDAILVKEAFGRGKEVSRSFWYEQLIPRAYAEGDAPAEGGGEAGGGSAEIEGGGCVVAGFKSKNRGGRCSIEEAEGEKGGCSSGSFPCNPVVFGYTQDGSPHCLSTSSREFQTATRVCHTQKAPLDSDENTKKFVDSILKKKHNKDLSQFLGADGKLTPEKFNELKGLVLDPFIREIDEAIRLCERPQQYDREQGSACETLKQRKATFTTYLESLKAAQQAGSSRLCPLEPPTPPPPPAGCNTPPAGSSAGGAPAGSAGGCPAGSAAGAGGAGSAGVAGSAQPGCGDQIPGGVSPPPAGSNTTIGAGSNDNKSEPGFFGRIWGGISSGASGIWNWMTGRGQSILLGLALTAGVGYLVYQLVKPPKKKSSPTPAQDPVAPPISAPVITPTTTPPPVTPSVR